MKSELRYKYLSLPRYNRYLPAMGNDIMRVKKLYNANIRLAQAFHPFTSDDHGHTPFWSMTYVDN